MYVNNIHMAVKKIQLTNFTKIEIQIVKYFFRHYKDRLNARQLAKILNLNHAHVNKLCSLLFKKKLLVKEKIGNSAYFTFDYNSSLAAKFMEYLLSLEETEFPEWLLVALHSLRSFNNHIKFGCVFGSSIKSKDFNDVDVLLVYGKENSNKIKLVKEEIRKSQLIDKPIRYMDITEQDIIMNKDKPIFYSILSENLIFYNPEKYVDVIRNAAHR